VHLAVDEDGLVEDARLLHLDPEVVALTGALAYARHHRDAGVLGGDVADQLLDHDGLAGAGAAEEADLATADERGDEVDDLDAGFEHGDLGLLLLEAGGFAVDGCGVLARDVAALVDGLAEDVEEAAERAGADGDGDRRARVDDL